MNTTQESAETKWLLQILATNIPDVWIKIKEALPAGVRIVGKAYEQGYATVVGPKDSCELLRDQIKDNNWGRLTETKQGSQYSFGSF